MAIQPFPPTKPEDAQTFTDAARAVARLREIYQTNTAFLREQFQRMAKGETPTARVRAFYPYVAITTFKPTSIDTRLSFGFVPGPGRYATTLTRPDLFETYYQAQFNLLLENHNVPIEIGVSNAPIPIHFAFNDGVHVEGQLDVARISMLRQIFDLPN